MARTTSAKERNNLKLNERGTHDANELEMGEKKVGRKIKHLADVQVGVKLKFS